jgi:bla regulator protein blaR1
MSALIPWGIETLIASTLLMALVLVIRTPVRRHFGPQIAYCLWALPLLRLLLPPLPAAWRETAATPISRAGETITIIMVDSAGSAVAAPTSAFPSLGVVLMALWMVGAAAFLIWHLARHAAFCRRMIDGGEALERRGSVRVISSDAAPGPLAFGIVRRYVAFPRDFAGRYDADERELALAHELGHHQRGDLIANWAALTVLAIHWFNPVAWRAFRAFRTDQELANDARVLAGRPAIDRHHYACAILKAAHGGTVSAACHLHTIEDLKGRLRMLTTMPTSRRRLALGTACIALLGATGLALTASGTAAAAAITTRVGETIGADLQTPPTPPEPPVAPEAPEAPVASVPAAPDAPPAPTAPAKHKHVVDKDGKVSTTTSDAAGFSEVEIDAMVKRAMADAPEVRERNCTASDGDERQMVVNSQEGAKRVMIICSNRIEQMSVAAAAKGEQAHRAGMQARRAGMQAGLAGIEAGRASILANRNLTDEQRKEALAGLDEAMAEMRAEMAKSDD